MASINTNLTLQNAPQRRYFLAIDGLEPFLWDDGGAAPVTSGTLDWGDGNWGQQGWGAGTWDRSGKVCLLPPQERSMTLDFGTMKPGLSQMTFDLLDIKDADGTSYFGKLFAPARWDVNPHARLLAGTAARQFVDADAASISLQGGFSGMAASGVAYIGTEAISYTGIDGSGVMSGVTKGLYPCVGDHWGKTYMRPEDSAADYLHSVGAVPFSFAGARVALYVTSYDPASASWPSQSEVYARGPLWVGNISLDIQHDPARNAFRLACTSVTDALTNAKIPTRLPSSELRCINLSGPRGISFVMEQWGPNGCEMKTTITIAAGVYDKIESVAAAVASKLNTTAGTSQWQNINGTPVRYGLGNVGYYYVKRSSEGKFSLTVQNAGNYDRTWRIVPRDPANNDPSLVLEALGFDNNNRQNIVVPSSAPASAELVAPNIPFAAFHPLCHDCNGQVLVLQSYYEFWTNQGDFGASRAAIRISGAYENNYTTDAIYLDSIDGTEVVIVKDPGMGAVGTRAALSLCYPYTQKAWGRAAWNYVGAREGESPKTVEQVWLPFQTSSASVKRGPFEMLLYPLLSTGTVGYNHATYDAMPYELSVGIQAELVDIQSFLDADRALASNALANHALYVIDKPISMMDLITRESMLFGHALVWSRGKLRIANVCEPSVDKWVVTLDETNCSSPSEMPVTTSDIGTVINQYACTVLDAEERELKLTVTDVDSAKALGVKEVTLSHPGMRFGISSSAEIQAILDKALQGRTWRYPQQSLKRSLAPFMMDRVGVGDVVKLSTTLMYDPVGSGTKAANTFAQVLQTGINCRTGVGSCTLIVQSRFNGTGDPWCPAALTDRAATNGGWDAANYRLTLLPLEFGESGDPDDGAALGVVGYKLMIVDAHAANPLTASPWHVTVASAYETDGAQVLTLEAVTLTGWDASHEYVVTFDARDVATAGQKTVGTWQASTVTELFSTSEYPQRYG